MHGPYVLGVDFGTTHTVAAVADAAGARVLVLDGAESQLPSCVLLDGEGRLVTGRSAQRAAALRPELFLAHPKQHIDEPSYLFGVQDVSMADVIAVLFGRVAAEARRQYGGAEPARVVVTHPASWVGRRLDTLRRAARLAGWPEAELLAEPVAAAAYHLGHGGREPGVVAVYDLGGGTFDVAVVRVGADGSLQVAADGGHPQVGGVHFDNAILRALAARYREEAPALWDGVLSPGSRDDRTHRLLLLEDIRFAKEQLSASRQQFIALPGESGDAVLTREELEAIVGPALEVTLDATQRAIAASGEQPGRIILVGGSSRMPLVHAMLSARFGIVPTTQGQPEHAVALGAALSPRGLGAPVVPEPGPAAPAVAPTPTYPPPAPVWPAPTPFASATAAPVRKRSARAGWLAAGLVLVLLLAVGGVVAALQLLGDEDPASGPRDTPSDGVTCADGSEVESRDDCPTEEETCWDGSVVGDVSLCPVDTRGCFGSGVDTTAATCAGAAREALTAAFPEIASSSCGFTDVDSDVGGEQQFVAGELYRLSCEHGGADGPLIIVSWWESSDFADDDVVAFAAGDADDTNDNGYTFTPVAGGPVEGGTSWFGEVGDDYVFYAAYASAPISVWIVGEQQSVLQVADHDIFPSGEDVAAVAATYTS